jgi:hypothetical protein
MTGIIRTFIAMALPIAALALTPSAAVAQSYSGDWPMTVSHSKYDNGKHCLALTDNGVGGGHSGEAVLVPQGTTYVGQFTVINGVITVIIPKPVDGELEFLVYTASASNGQFGSGAYSLAYGGYFDSGALVFGTKNGCS